MEEHPPVAAPTEVVLLRSVGKYWNRDWTARPDGVVMVTNRYLRFEASPRTGVDPSDLLRFPLADIRNLLATRGGGTGARALLGAPHHASERQEPPPSGGGQSLACRHGGPGWRGCSSSPPRRGRASAPGPKRAADAASRRRTADWERLAARTL